ncbi:hypothetical protein EPN29_13520 [bacterium]|nr:MAG: hypothetical protein EPN29_13520 [bacterium]
MTLGQRSSEQARENDLHVLEALVGAGDQGLVTVELAARVHLPERTCRAAIDRLISRRLVAREGQRGRVFATIAGRTEAGAGIPGVDVGQQLGEAIACFPSEAQQAFARLLLSGIVARHHLAVHYTDGWGGFICCGPTQTGKTSLARLPCRIFGWDELGTLRMLPDETPGSVFARRVQRADGFTVEQPAILRNAYVCFDEWDKAEPDVRKAAGQLLMGYVATELEGARVEIRPSVMVCLNTGPEGLAVLNQAYVRRSVVLDTGALTGLLDDIDEAMRRLYRRVAIPRLDLDHLRPPAQELPDEERKELRDDLRQGLTQEGWQLCDVEALSRLALGRAALQADNDLRRAAHATALDYLTCSATVGHAVPGFASRVSRELGGRGPLGPDPAAAQAEVEARRVAKLDAERREAEARIKFEAERERLAALLVEARTALGHSRNPQARALMVGLASAAREVRGARSRETLALAWQTAEHWLQEARAWRQDFDRQRTEAAQRAQQLRAMRERERRDSALRTRQAQAEKKKQRARWEQWRRALADLVPLDPDSTLMGKLEELGAVNWVANPAMTGGWANRLKVAVVQGTGHWDYRGLVVAASDAEDVWLNEWHIADDQVAALGGRRLKPPVFRQRRLA